MAKSRPLLEDIGIVISVPRSKRAQSEDRSDLHRRNGGSRGKKPNPRPSSDGRGNDGGLGKAARIAARNPEVMVKVSSCSRGENQLREHLNYITRNGKLVADTPNGEVAGRDEVARTAQQWWHNNGEAAGQRRAPAHEIVIATFSISAGADRDKLVANARDEIADSMERGMRWRLSEQPTQSANVMKLRLVLPLDADVELGKNALDRFLVRSVGWDHDGRFDEVQTGSKESVNLVLSMPPGTDREKFLAGAKLFVERTFGENHDFLLAEHRDTEHPHVHVAVRSLGYDGTRLQHKKEDLREWREALAAQLRTQGLEAEASPRRTRGVVQKPKTQVIFHLDQKGASKIQRNKVEAAVREITGQVQQGKCPWEDASMKQQHAVRGAWARLADRLDAVGGEERGMAVAIRSFLGDMPPIETERQRMRRLAQEHLPSRSVNRGTKGDGGREVEPDL
ncbi:hypothetical protein LMG31884_46990 (plasmid) [Xanthomonas hydrangeae]|uniref:relaxase/mobilization nuclease domain-containing protein n=1 Tax=Xanthomonas hydrangeae TaxID=2775159 RepID=UPI001963F399|nr:hypothetical protein LMG31884_46990 [Xanthomonas hydrangeae]CAD7740872.1 hypothetical protein LMG31884_46990 [Xanthomonas hydrangeae]CAD7747858.1 hypothetical protein LMG31887_46000 [Xanthomonas hydrangeae]CAD7747859.1 hypothetical protein LMG31887_46000 [Xanthomonas hydrangeae]CAD7748264.1 hypothetical protein LMG31885_45490 [Xanthomonas hydrangeae]